MHGTNMKISNPAFTFSLTLCIVEEKDCNHHGIFEEIVMAEPNIEGKYQITM